MMRVRTLLNRCVDIKKICIILPIVGIFISDSDNPIYDVYKNHLADEKVISYRFEATTLFIYLR